MRKYRDKNNIRVVEVDDLSFLSDRNHRYGWLKRHYKHYRMRRALKKAKVVIASNPEVASAVTRYYFIPKDRISVRQNQDSKHERNVDPVVNTLRIY